jgi:polysaccharide lyase-like protein
VSILAALPFLVACAPKVSAGEYQCSADEGASDGGASGLPLETDPVNLPWSTGFEAGFCDYTKIVNYCYGDAPYVLVQEPHHGGRFAAEFKVGDTMKQTRCVRGGLFPESAYYSAWYYIPEALKDIKSAWNLWHFQGGADPDSLHDLWDVNLSKGVRAGEWELAVLDRTENFTTYRSADHISVPIGSWFQITLFLKRASDASGEIKLYQGSTLLFDQTNLKSDASADGATPATSSVYVDDVSISATFSATQ